MNDRDATNKLPTRNQKQIPITVRQLEALVRLSEAFAKMELSETVTENHVRMAHDLFRVRYSVDLRNRHSLLRKGCPRL